MSGNRLKHMVIFVLVMHHIVILSLCQDIAPNAEWRATEVGKIDLMIGNSGTNGGHLYDASTGRHRGFIYPRNSNIFMGDDISIWIGGIVGKDTLVSIGGSIFYSEFVPPSGSEGVFSCKSLIKTSDCPQQGAVSEQDFLCVYTDTITDPSMVYENPYDNRAHKPLYVSINQCSYVWGAEYADDFILFDFQITNTGEFPIQELYFGILCNSRLSGPGPDAEYQLDGSHAYTGYLEYVDNPDGDCQSIDTINIAWNADNDGHPNDDGEWDYKSNRSVMGFKVLRPSKDSAQFNYNWWNSLQYSRYFGPRKAGTEDDPFREFELPLAYPATDEDKYYVLSHPERDYDQIYTALNHTSEGFLPQPVMDHAVHFASGGGEEYLYSFGPFDLAPGDTIPVTFALVCGENFHVNPRDYEYYFDPFNPDEYYNRLDFSSLVENARWAEAVFDNPGVDTDGDGYMGEFCWIYDWLNDDIVDSTRKYYTGDGIPDFRAMTPPPPPVVRTCPEYGQVTIRWNGQESETTPDYFSGEIDFEGYNIYLSQNDRPGDFVKIASYDIADYIVYAFDPDNRVWNKISNSAKLDSLRNVHGLDFDPDEYYDEMHYLDDHTSDQIIYFKPQGWNQSEMGLPGTIRKVYPDTSPDDPTDLTPDGWMRYYEYEYTVKNLQASVPFYFAVTAFDNGAEKYDIGVLETSPLTNAVQEYPMPSSDIVEEEGLAVTVYPNPYRIDGGYARAGYENRDRTRSADWTRAIHFANLPCICKIRIYSVDGDLIKEIDHYNPEGGAGAQEETWNVISKNTQAVVSGLYIWTVSSEMGKQIGKLVILK